MWRKTGRTYSDGTPAETFCYDGTTAGSCSGAPSTGLLKGRMTMASNASGVVKWTSFDALGRVLGMEQTVSGAGAWVSSYGYNHQGLTSMTYPSGRVVSYSYDNAGMVSGVGGANPVNAYASAIEYEAMGGRKKMVLGHGLTESWDYSLKRGQARRMRLGTAAAPGSVGELEFSYCAGLGYAAECAGNNGNLQSQVIRPLGATQTYSYDALNRLGGVTGEAGWSRSYGYDRYGNGYVTSATGLAAGATTASSAANYNTLNQLLVNGSGYDGTGQLTAMGGWTYSYNATGQMRTSVSSGGTTTYLYDALGRRVSKTTGSTVVRFAYDAMGKLIAEYGGVATGSGLEYMTGDHLGSTRLVTSASSPFQPRRVDYLPYGETLLAGFGGRTAAGGYETAEGLGVLSVRFTGKERDGETASSMGPGLDYFGARYMSAAQGRFTSPDSKQSSAKLDNPQSWNRYSYTDNNPLAFVDPDGKEKLRVTLTTYIPGQTITDPFGRIYNANGNGRGSTPFDYKTRQTATVETDRRISSSGKIGEPTGVVGITQRFDKNGNEIDRAKEPDSAVKQSAGRQEDGSVGIWFSGAATNPLGLPGTPSIDFHIAITCTSGSCSATGAHDGFPGYRIEVTNQAGKTTEIYTYDPIKAGKTPTALFPPMDCQVPRSEGCSAGQGPKQ